MENCKLCGAPLAEGKCPTEHSFKKMCINCAFCSLTENGEVLCVNEDNRKIVIDRMLKAAGDASTSYVMQDMESVKAAMMATVKPIPLSKPLSHCPKWGLSDEVLEEVKNLFV